MHEKQRTTAVFNKLFEQSETAHVTQIHFAIGEISELDQGVIQQWWVVLSKGTPLEQAQLHFRLIPAEAQCMACFKKYHPINGIIHCPNCGSFGAKILSGEEFHVEHIEMDND